MLNLQALTESFVQVPETNGVKPSSGVKRFVCRHMLVTLAIIGRLCHGGQSMVLCQSLLLLVVELLRLVVNSDIIRWKVCERRPNTQTERYSLLHKKKSLHTNMCRATPPHTTPHTTRQHPSLYSGTSR